MDRSKLKVLIVGGSVAGLTLAHCLERAGIAYAVLEKHGVAPNLGASLGIMPNGARILDQLGIYTEMEALAAPMHAVRFMYNDGYSFMDRSLSTLNPRFGYSFMFLERRQILEVLYSTLKHQSAVLTHKEVVCIEQTTGHVRVTTKDGSTYHGDIVVGADGVHSTVRSEMGRVADHIPMERNQWSAQYSCVSGISSHVEGLTPGEVIWASHDHRSIVTFPAKDGGVFWFLILKLEKRYQYPKIPRYSQEDAIKACQKHTHLSVTDRLTFNDIWNQRKTFSMTALEEGTLQTWCAGRIVCIGDSVHKMNPEIGQGANMAIEDAAALTNVLQGLLARLGGEKPSTADLAVAMRTFNRHRLPRTTRLCVYGTLLSRLTNRDGIFNALLGRYIVPYSLGLSSYLTKHIITHADWLEYIDVPVRAGPDFARPGRERRVSPALIPLVTSTVVSLFFLWKLWALVGYANW
ncbi:flavo protein monooxygenase [Aspergillus coremiiformis]|uniref:Flavo protein monooxygenase n=1 Tax=Aspergillus coremiiformis TaxID=138285 RepID=A0A5N6ZDE4_9EURO|nr:flavo protein monooxygenase [Aspergillus coremiiformis]